VRLSSVDGQVRIAQGTEILADQAVANTPLFEGTRVATEEDGRAEIQLEDGSVARLSPNSALTLAVLRGQGGSGETEMVLEGGLGYFEVQGGGQAGTIKIRFGDSVVTVSGYTVLRVNLDSPPGELAVFSGNAHLERGSTLSIDLHGGESATLSGSDAARYELNDSIETRLVGLLELRPRPDADGRSRLQDGGHQGVCRQRQPGLERPGREWELVQRAGAGKYLVAL